MGIQVRDGRNFKKGKKKTNTIDPKYQNLAMKVKLKKERKVDFNRVQTQPLFFKKKCMPQ